MVSELPEPEGHDTKTELARARSREAADRTLMAWVRTALTLIGFGFGIEKVFDFLAEAEPGRAPSSELGTRFVGGAFVLLGTVSLLLAVAQHWHTLKQLERHEYAYAAAWPLVQVVALILAAIGALALVAIFS